MGRAAGRIFVAVLWLTWFTLVVPLHTRGMLTVDCCNIASPAVHLPPCCMHRSDSRAPATPDHSTPAERCSICLTTTVAGVDAPIQAPSLAPGATHEIVNDTVLLAPPQARVDDSRCRGPPSA